MRKKYKGKELWQEKKLKVWRFASFILIAKHEFEKNARPLKIETVYMCGAMLF